MPKSPGVGGGDPDVPHDLYHCHTNYFVTLKDGEQWIVVAEGPDGTLEEDATFWHPIWK
jgi:hypothetical protein